MTLRRLVSFRLNFALAILLSLLIAGAAAASTGPAYWLPTQAQPRNAADQLDLFYHGESGRVVGLKTDADLDLLGLGASRCETAADEELYVYLLADASLAEFAVPARILIRSGHEVLVATSAGPPRLSDASAEALPGLQQPVRVSSQPLVWPGLAGEGHTPLGAREADPLIQGMVDAFSSVSYMSTWQALEDFVTRYTHAPENEAATQWILDQFVSFGLAAEFHYYNQSGLKRNVVATLPGLVHPDQVVYLTAHMDATSPTPESCAPGADDNGSGTAAIIEAARVLSQYSFEYTIKFVAFNGEEQGLVGSGAYVSDIAALGEDVIGDFNIDMIAYRGTDGGAADLIFYTNSASQWMANAVADACNDYVPGTLEPIIIVENLAASDHASYWNYGYHAISSIEDEAWGDDFCPWYHTCNDLVERYPLDYVVNCAKANLGALATTAVPLNPSGPYLVLSETTLDDDANAPSQGDGDGILNPGETVELWVAVRNVGTATAQNVSGVLATSSAAVSIQTDAAAWNDIPSQAEGSNLSPFVFTVDGTAPDGELLPFTLTLNNAIGSQDLSFQFGVVAPDLAYYFQRLSDNTAGNDNGIYDPGEIVQIHVSLANQGGKDAASVSAQLVSGSPHVIVLEDQAAAASILTGEEVELAPAYRIQIGAGAPAGEVLPLNLAISTDAGYEAASGFQVKVGTRFYDEIEAEGAWSLAAAGDDAATGQWERVDPNGSWQDGQPCQPDNDHTAAPGTDCFVTEQGPVDGGAGTADVDDGKTTLTSPVFDLSQVIEARATYWRWFTNNLGNNGNEDEWVVQVSADGGGSWVDLERTTQSQNSWQERSFLLTDYIVPTATVVFRFIAEDEGGGSLVEAAVDDFEVSGLIQPVTSAESDQPTHLRLALASANPARAGSEVAFTLPTRSQVSLKLYGVNGRLVRTLAEGGYPAGTHSTSWDGKNNQGHRVAPGVYFYRLQAEQQILTRKLVVLH